MTNNKGYAEIITVSIILGIIGALFITGVYVWQEIEKNKNFQHFITQLQRNQISQTKNTTSALSCNDLFYIAGEMTKSYNFCQSDSDCVIVDDAYPYGCYYLKNKLANDTTFKNLVTEYGRLNCDPVFYDCVNIKSTTCQDNKCVAEE